MKRILLAAAALAALNAAAHAADQVKVQIVPNPQWQGVSAHRLACNEWERCIQVPGYTGRGSDGVVSTQNSWFTNGDPPAAGRPGGLEFTKPN